MKHLILVDLNSMHLNENRGSFTTTVRTGQSISFESEVLPDDFIDGENCTILEWREENGKKTNIKGEIIDQSLFDKCISEKRPGIKLTQNFNTAQIHHSPIPKYSFKYTSTIVECINCKEKINSEDLESDSTQDTFSDRICPKCNCWDYCELEYETIEEALNRKVNE